MENYRLFIGLFFVGTFVSVNSLQCYACNNCTTNSLTDAHLRTCSAEIPTTIAPNGTECINCTENITTDVTNISNLDNGNPINLQSVAANDTIKYVCAVGKVKGNSTEMLVRGCALAQIDGKEFCTFAAAALNFTNCKTCDKDKCNSAYSVQYSLVLLSLVASSILLK